MGVPERGEQVIRNMQAAIEEIHSSCAGDSEKASGLLRGVGQAHHRLSALGGRIDRSMPAAPSSATPAKPLTAEEVAQAAPDVLLAAWCGAGDRVPLDKIVEQRKWNELPAVRASRVFCINDELLNTPASNLAQGLRAIAWALHPDRFAQPTGIRQMQSPTIS